MFNQRFSPHPSLETPDRDSPSVNALAVDVFDNFLSWVETGRSESDFSPRFEVAQEDLNKALSVYQATFSYIKGLGINGSDLVFLPSVQKQRGYMVKGEFPDKHDKIEEILDMFGLFDKSAR